MIRIQNIDKYYNRQKPNEIHVLNDVTYEFPESGMCAIFGLSGCGKTTLLNVLGGLDKPTSGVVSYGETALADDEDRIRNRDIGFIFQNYNLNRDETVFDNVADSLRLCGVEDSAVIEERVMTALNNVGMGKFHKRLPDTLSGGQQQRVAIARAIVKNPKVILADEPTGNLDEANTLLVMDILKTMSREHLVILVTHEAKLVDYYCDSVIELSDGRIVGTRENDNTSGYVGRNRNEIFLGELEESENSDDNSCVRFYGDKMDNPVRLTLVHKNGRIFLRVDSENVTVLDSSSEVKLREGVYEEAMASAKRDAAIDMSKLPTVEGDHYGRLFRLKDSIKQGFRANFRNTKGAKKRNALIACMFFFGVALVFFTAMYGTELRNLREIRKSMNDKTFFLYGGNDISDRISAAAADPASGIDYVDTVRTHFHNNTKSYFYLQYASFETFGYHDKGFDFPEEEAYDTEVLPISLVKNAEVRCGTKELKADDEIVISTQVADRLLETTPYNYIRGYAELMGIYCHMLSDEGGYRIVGVVESSENAVYCSVDRMNEISCLYKNVHADNTGYFKVAPGECTLITTDRKNDTELEYAVGDTLLVNGVSLTVKNVIDLTKLEKIRYKMIDESEYTPEEKEQLTKQSIEIAEQIPQAVYMSGGSVATGGIVHWKSGRFFVVNKEDFGTISRTNTKTSTWVTSVKEETRGKTQVEAGGDTYKPYYRLHSTDPDATLEYLRTHFSDVTMRNLDFESEIATGIITPNDRFQRLFKARKTELLEQLAILGVFFLFYGICMNLVMRSAVMNRTKEIGIYRAIGAKKSNIVFRFAVESAVVLMLSAVIGFLIVSVAIGYFSGKTAFSETSSFYYPLWMAVSLFIFLMVTGVVCGILPVIKLLRKTPSEILAKYDI
jgi:ABC-type antimicrobial peptide transport system, ATPase component